MYYDFMTLAPNDFEALSADLLGKVFGWRLEAFKTGKDSGIDLRHALSQDGQGDVIIQCKRYATNKFNDLLRSLKNELKNLAILKPTRYIISTSVALTPSNKKLIIKALDPWIRSSDDIVGPDELNQMLRAYPEIVGTHFKLWISSTAVLERVLNARIFAQTEATLEATRQYASKLVVHAGLNRALDILRARHHVMVVGNPGIGKTTLARMLMCHYMEEGFEPVWVIGNIEDAWTVIHSAVGSERKFVIVYDDFLGRLQFDAEKFGKNEDASLLSLLDRAARLPNLRLILTTREYIFADAKRLHGTLDARAGDIVKYTLSLAVYSRQERAQMLFNHLYFSDLPDSRLRKLVEIGAYRNVIKHEHFNPRIVESVSNFANSQALNDEQYLKFFESEFDNPAKLWERPFFREIGAIARQTLVGLWSFGKQAEIGLLEKSVRKMNANLSAVDFRLQFEDALRQLEGNFTISNRYPTRERRKAYLIIEFQNPSIEELIDSVVIDQHWIQELIGAAVTINQVQTISRAMQRMSNIASRELWLKLRVSATACETINAGRLFNYQRWDERKPVRTWSYGELSKAEILLYLLQLEKFADSEDHRQEQLYNRVLTESGWFDLLEALPGNTEIAFSIYKLQQWIVASSDWPAERISLAEHSLRSGLIKLFSIDHAWPTDVVSIETLAEAASFVNKSFCAKEVAVIAEAAKQATVTAQQNGWEVTILRDEIDALEHLGRRLNLSFSLVLEQLRETVEAREIEEEANFDQQLPADIKRFDERIENVDVDQLFQGLTER